jgi:hypothetical protein
MNSTLIIKPGDSLHIDCVFADFVPVLSLLAYLHEIDVSLSLFLSFPSYLCFLSYVLYQPSSFELFISSFIFLSFLQNEICEIKAANKS